MNQYPQQYYMDPSQYQALQSQYQTLQWQSILGALMSVAMLIAMGAWALSLVKKAIRGEKVEFPL